MIITPPAARVPIVDVKTGMMVPTFQRAMQALCDSSNGLFAGDVSGPSAILDGISDRHLLIRITFDLVPATDGASLYLLARTGLGVDVTAYSWSWPYNDSATTAASVEDTSDTQIVLATAVQSDALTGGISGNITVHSIHTTRYKRVTGQCAHFDGARERSTIVSGRIDTAEHITGLKMMFSTGDIASGYARVEAP